MNILIADDHTIVRRGLKQLLQEEYPLAVIDEAGNAEEIVSKVLLQKWGILICDINMPGRSGIEVLPQIKQMAPDMPVLIMSMYPEDQYALQAFKAGASGYLGKESIHIDLFDAIEKVTNGKKFITQSIAEKLANSFYQQSSSKLSHESLSSREYEVFMLIVAGKSTSAIAEHLNLSPTTISTYKIRILEKMGIKSNAELTRYAIENKLI